MPNIINNNGFLEVSGAYNGSNETQFIIKVSGLHSAETWHYEQINVADQSTTTVSSEVPIAVDTAYQLGSTGVYIKFTQEYAYSYQADDEWRFTTSTDVKLPDDVDYDYIEVIDTEDESNLVAVSKATGAVAVITNINKPNPALDVSVQGVNIGADSTGITVLDFERKNKELYVAKGPDAPPVWLGYTGASGFQGTLDATLKATPAMDDLVGSENAQEDTFNKSIMLRGGGGSSTTNAKCIVGIKKDINSTAGEYLSKVFIMNIADGKLYNWSTATEPIAIKRWYGKVHTVSGVSYCDGFAIMRRHQDGLDSEYGCSIDFWDMNTAVSTYVGQQAYRYNTIHIKKPLAEKNYINSFSDFLIVPLTSEMASWRVMVSRSRAETKDWDDDKRGEYSWLWTSLGLPTAKLETDGFIIADDIAIGTDTGHLSDMTPSLYTENLDTNTRIGGEMYYMARMRIGGDDLKSYNHIGGAYIPALVPVHASHFHLHNTTRSAKTTFRDTSIHCLEFGGFDDTTGTYGIKPIVYFTIQAPHPEYTNNPTKYYTALAVYDRMSRVQQEIITRMSGRTYADSNNQADKESNIMTGTNGQSSYWHNPITGPFISDNGEVLTNGDTGTDTYGGVSLSGCSYSTSSSTITHNITPLTLTTGMWVSLLESNSPSIPNHARVGVVTDATHFELTDAAGVALLPASNASGKNLFINTHGNNLTNSSTQVFRGLNWVTYAIDATTSSSNGVHSNIGRAKHPIFAHARDWNSTQDVATAWSNIAQSNLTIDNKIDSAVAALGRAHDKVTVSWHSFPRTTPVFGVDGRIVASTVGAKRLRHLICYVRSGNYRVLYFRFGKEAGYPQNELNPLIPRLFPNDWTHTSTTNNAYYYWNIGVDADNRSHYDVATGTNHYGTSALAELIKRSGYIVNSGVSGDNASWRISEQGNIATNAWYPTTGEVLFVSSVPVGNFNLKQLFKVQGDANNANEFLSSAAQFSIETPVESTPTADIWSGISCRKVFYKATIVYDGYQESALISTMNSLYVATDITKHIHLEIKVAYAMPLSDRATSIAVYRATSGGDTANPETLYRFIDEIPLYQFNEGTNGFQTASITDTGRAEGTYESINGLSEQTHSISLNYGVNTQQNGFHFVGNCSHAQLPESDNYLFRSQPGKFSIFDWTKDFVQLPFIPVALKGFMGKVYAFSNNQIAVINPNTLFIEDVIDGMGCINSKSILVTGGGMMWCDYKNIYLASPSIKAIGTTIQTVETDGWLNIPASSKDNARCGYDAKRNALLIFFTVSTRHRCWAYSVNKNRWDLFETPLDVKDTALTKDGATILLLSNNKLAKFLAHSSERLDWYWESKKIQLGNTMISKKIRNIKVEGNDKFHTLLEYKLDGDSSWKTGTAESTIGPENKAIVLDSGDKSKKVHWIKTKISGDNNQAGSDVKVYASSIIFKQKKPK